jgi:hypothetical protein
MQFLFRTTTTENAFPEEALPVMEPPPAVSAELGPTQGISTGLS